MKAGFYECDITPPLGTECPGSFRKRLIMDIHDPLKVRACVLSDGEIKVALVGIDTIGTGVKFLRTVEELLPEYKLITSASHTHYGGNLRDKISGIESAPEEIRQFALVDATCHDPAYYAFCIKQMVTAVKMADSKLTEVEFSFGRRRVENLIFNRRIRMKDGNVQTHPGKGNPNAVDYAGPVDDELGTVGVWKKGSDELLGCLMNFSCHACIRLDGATADFPGVAVDTVRKVYGSDIGVVYINGASGDVTQIDNLSLRRDKGGDIAEKLGRVVGAKAVEILSTADRGECNTLRCLTSLLPLERNVLSEEYVQECWRIVREEPDSALAKLSRSQLVREYGARRSSEPVEKLQVLQIGPLVIGSSGGEMFAQYALDFKKSSPFPYTWYSQLSNDQLGYVLTPDCYEGEGGGYEKATSRFAPDTGTKIIKTLEEMVAQLTPEEEPAPDLVEQVVKVWDFNFERK